MSGQTAAMRFRLALDMFSTGEALMRQRLRRLHPSWSEERIEDAIVKWLRERPGAETGDAAGRPVDWANRSG